MTKEKFLENIKKIDMIKLIPGLVREKRMELIPFSADTLNQRPNLIIINRKGNPVFILEEESNLNPNEEESKEKCLKYEVYDYFTGKKISACCNYINGKVYESDTKNHHNDLFFAGMNCVTKIVFYRRLDNGKIDHYCPNDFFEGGNDFKTKEQITNNVKYVIDEKNIKYSDMHEYVY